MRLLNRYAQIFSDPSFWVLAIIIIALLYFFYKFAMRAGAEGYSEEEVFLQESLQQQHLELVKILEQASKKPDFSDFLEKEKVVYTYYKVEVKKIGNNAPAPPTEMWAQIQYGVGNIAAVNWWERQT